MLSCSSATGCFETYMSSGGLAHPLIRIKWVNGKLKKDGYCARVSELKVVITLPLEPEVSPAKLANKE